MFCPKCSHENTNEAVFCIRCGCHMETAFQKESFRTFLKRFISSPLFLCLCIAFTLSFVFQLFNIAGLPDIIRDSIYEEFFAVRIEPFVILSTVFSALFSMIPQALLLVGLWLLFAWSKRLREDGAVSGLGFVKSYVIINEVLSYIAYGFLALVLVLTCLAVSLMNMFDPEYYYSIEYGFITAALLVPLVCLFVFVIAAIVLTVIYYVKLRRTIKDTRKAYEAGEGKVRCSSYVFVVHYIIAAFSLIGAIPAVLSSGISGFFSCLAAGAVNVILGMIFSSYKKEIERR